VEQFEVWYLFEITW